LTDGITANIKYKQDHIDSLRNLGSDEMGKVIEIADKEVTKMVVKRKADHKTLSTKRATD